jgi:2-keto-4-pentenoate hydratase
MTDPSSTIGYGVISRHGAASGNGATVVSPLAADAIRTSGVAYELPSSGFIQVTAGLVLAIGADLDGPLRSSVAASEAISSVVASIEVFSGATGALGTLVLGRSIPWEGQDLALLGAMLERNGVLGDTGAGAAALEDPILAVVAVSTWLDTRGAHLRRGDLVYTGRLMQPSTATAGDVITATFAHLGALNVTFA